MEREEKYIEILNSSKFRKFCQKNSIKELSVFGSIVKGNFTNESDIDLLVKFAPGSKIGLMGIAEIQIELSQLLKRNVDLVQLDGLKKYIKDEIINSSRLIYAG